MFDQDLIRKWLDEGTINQSQAEKMRADLEEYKTESRSKKQVIAFSTIGAILIGIGAILFVASNWEKIGDTVRILLLAGSTVAIHYVGYYLRFENKKYPRLGFALLFLSALFFGASLFLIAQIYNINANSSTLILIWLLGVLPLIYGYRSSTVVGLCSLLFYLWIGLLYGERNGSNELLNILDTYLISGIALYLTGILHELSEKVKDASAAFKFMGLQAVLFVLFIRTFGSWESKGEEIVPVIYALLGIVFLAVLLSKSLRLKITNFQTGMSLAVISFLMAGITLIAIYSPMSKEVYIGFFNIVFLGLLVLLLYAGYNSEDIEIVNTAMFWFIPLIFARYFDFFWELLPRSFFFMLGGLALLTISVVLERKRRELKAQFAGVKR
jgi:uncharacterized membrane protein